ncbi:hypothetical protein MHBO_001263 [Bonamia ostreae]|uniref:Uncharacterized protein n=1 Tax=Bonamia ostreae TaxID=126728 RepID=A0ABV2AID6_9EUKA
MARVRKILATIARNNCNLEYRSEAGLGGRKAVVVLGVSDYSNSHINRLRSDFLRAAGSDALAIASESTASPLEKVLVPRAAFAVGEFLSHHGFDAFVVLDDLAMHSKQRNELLRFLSPRQQGGGRHEADQHLRDAPREVRRLRDGARRRVLTANRSSLTAICAASKNVVGKTNRLFYDAWADLESNCDSSLHLDKIFVDTDLNSARFAKF